MIKHLLILFEFTVLVPYQVVSDFLWWIFHTKED